MLEAQLKAEAVVYLVGLLTSIAFLFVTTSLGLMYACFGASLVLGFLSIAKTVALNSVRNAQEKKRRRDEPCD